MSDCRKGGRLVYEKPTWTPTVVSFFREMDTSELRAVYVNGVRFVREECRAPVSDEEKKHG